MNIIIAKDYEDMSKKAANLIIEAIKEDANIRLGLATGGSPMRIYEILTQTKLDWSRVITFNLDEYVNIAPTNPHSYRYFMNENLFNKININLNNTFFPLNFGDLQKNGLEYEKIIELYGGIDLQLLSIGENGHIAFNEPGIAYNKHSGYVKLTSSTINANKRFFSSVNDVPTSAISMSIAAILKAKKIIFVASGVKKADAIERMINGPITTNLPASYLQKHKNVTVIIDQDAASKLNIK